MQRGHLLSAQDGGEGEYLQGAVVRQSRGRGALLQFMVHRPERRLPGKCSTVSSLISICVTVVQLAATVEHSEKWIHCISVKPLSDTARNRLKGGFWDVPISLL